MSGGSSWSPEGVSVDGVGDADGEPDALGSSDGLGLGVRSGPVVLLPAPSVSAASRTAGSTSMLSGRLPADSARPSRRPRRPESESRSDQASGSVSASRASRRTSWRTGSTTDTETAGRVARTSGRKVRARPATPRPSSFVARAWTPNQ